MKPLTDRQERFVLEYAIDQNASAAAVRAGYSAKTKGTHAAQLMKDPAVKERIVVELADLYARLRVNATEVLQAQVRAAYLDPAKLFDAAQEPIPLDALDEDTRGGLTVSYAKRRSGDYTMRVKQTPRHIALAVLQKRLDAFAKLQEETFACWAEEEEPERAQQTAQSPAQRDEAPAQRAPGPLHAIGQALKGLGPRLFNLEFKLAEPGPAQQPPSAQTPLARALQAVGRQPMPERATAPFPGSLAEAAATLPVDKSDPPPPSPYEPGYDFKKDPSAINGGRFVAWNRYWQRKRDEAQAKAEEAAALASAPPNMVVKAGSRVPVRMEPGYNPPWLRENRPQFAIGAGETYMD
jgi:hypothetical protein